MALLGMIQFLWTNNEQDRIDRIKINENQRLSEQVGTMIDRLTQYLSVLGSYLKEFVLLNLTFKSYQKVLIK